MFEVWKLLNYLCTGFHGLIQYPQLNTDLSVFICVIFSSTAVSVSVFICICDFVSNFISVSVPICVSIFVCDQRWSLCWGSFWAKRNTTVKFKHYRIKVSFKTSSSAFWSNSFSDCPYLVGTGLWLCCVGDTGRYWNSILNLLASVEQLYMLISLMPVEITCSR